MFGAIVSATDPVAVLSIFGEVNAPKWLATLVTGESLFNDGTALVLFTTLLGIATTHVFDPGATITQILLAVVGGISLGIGVGFIGSVLVQRIDDALLETTITLILAYGGYLLASALAQFWPTRNGHGSHRLQRAWGPGHVTLHTHPGTCHLGISRLSGQFPFIFTGWFGAAIDLERSQPPPWAGACGGPC